MDLVVHAHRLSIKADKSKKRDEIQIDEIVDDRPTTGRDATLRHLRRRDRRRCKPAPLPKRQIRNILGGSGAEKCPDLRWSHWSSRLSPCAQRRAVVDTLERSPSAMRLADPRPRRARASLRGLFHVCSALSSLSLQRFRICGLRSYSILTYCIR